MDVDINISHIITVVIALLGWLAAHRLTSARELTNKRREIRTQYLLEAYRRLELSSNPNNPSETWKDIESAIADIQLLGTPDQVELARKFSEKMGETDQASTKELLIDLRKTLRKELELEPVESELMFLRIGGKQHNQ